jgi:catechol 2,3-dioxygenase-like lactoylglutathione lyase family enzyme
MPALEGVLETVLYVDDLDRARRFYEGLLGLVPVYSDQRMSGYDVGGRSMLLLFRRGQSLVTVTMPGGTIPPHDGRGPHHVAFAIAAAELAEWETCLRDAGVDIEGRTVWPRGGTSLYFRDPDGHLLELATPGLWPGH